MNARSLRILAVLGLLSALAVTPSAKATEATHVGSIGTGDALVWNGPFVREAHVFWELCDVSGPCFRYAFDVTEPGALLKVAIDAPSDDQWAVAVFPPGEDPAPLVWNPVPDASDGGLDRAALACCGTVEFYLENPPVGRYHITVDPLDVTAASFRMRAVLEGVRKLPRKRTLLAPNLRAHPPFEPTFAAPARQVRAPYTVGGAGTPGGPQAPLQVGGMTPVSCTADETVEQGATRCLRVSTGIENIGNGPLHLRLAPVTSEEPAMTQVLHYSDGSTQERPAGQYVFHRTHLHYHAADLAMMRLYRVWRARVLTEVGQGHKQSFCLGDIRIVDFQSTKQDRAGSTSTDCGALDDASMALTRGWVDIYPWSLPDNYVEFGDNPDGFYVLRATADAFNRILETNERDNAAYAYLRITGNHIDVLERGYGAHPWDPRKVVLPAGPW